jgi:anti-anti-sigma factor
MEPILNAHFDAASERTTWKHDVCPEFESATINRSSVDGNRTVISFPYRLVASELPTFLQSLKLDLAEDQPELVIDMSLVKETDTAGLVILLQCIAEVVRRDGSFVVSGMSPEAATLIELTGLDRLIRIPKAKFESGAELEFLSPVTMEDADAGSAVAA